MEDKGINEILKNAASSAMELIADLIFKPIDVKGVNIQSLGTAYEFFAELPENLVVTPVNFNGAAEGTMALIALPFDVSLVAKLMMGAEAADANEELVPDDLTNFQEAVSQAGIAVASKLSGMLNASVQTATAESSVGFEQILETLGSKSVTVARVAFSIEDEESEIIMVWEQPLIDAMGEQFDAPEEAPVIAEDPVEEMPLPEVPSLGEAVEAPDYQEEPAMAAAPQSQAFKHTEEEPAWQGLGETGKSVGASLDLSLSPDDQKNLNLLMDVPLEVTVELGRTMMSVKDILALSEGTVIQLNRLAGEPVDFLVNGKLISKGEVVVIDENFGIRITEIVAAHERIKSL